MDEKRFKANHYLDSMGIKHANTGFRYLITALEIGADNPQLLYKISDLYEEIAQIHGTKKTNVEKSIRYCVSPSGMTNKEFISRAVDNLYLQPNTN
ncbi:MAG TPA: hypothetical protein GXZ52_02280 [Clostridiales bacterium]|nr:hypothetical protein [Clostridiales bacterium]